MDIVIQEKINKFDTARTLLEKDIWEVEALGIKVDTVNSIYRFNFTRLKSEWLKQAVKKICPASNCNEKPSKLSKLYY